LLFRTVALEVTNNKVVDLVPELKNKPIEAIILYGSNAQPETMRKGSDLDLKIIVALDQFDDEFKYLYSNNHYCIGDDMVEVELKYYTPESFRKEMLFGSFTRLFALLNAYSVLDDQTGNTTTVINQAHERMDEIISEVRISLTQVNISKEITNLRNYMSKSYHSLLSEKLRNNRLGLGLRLFEYSKHFIVQYERLSFAWQLQNNVDDPLLDVYMKNMLMFQQPDGNRLLDYRKYKMDSAIITLITTVNELIQSSEDLLNMPISIYGFFDEIFHDTFGTPLLIDDSNKNEFFTFQTVGV
jgi:hypothetical protein